MKCKEDICSSCLKRNGGHNEHKTLAFKKLIDLTEEIKSKLKYKTYDECLIHLENIKEKINTEKNKNIENFQDIINNMINKIKITEDNYIKEINEKMDKLNQILDIIKESYKYFYAILSNEMKDYNNLDFLKQITEIVDIKCEYNGFDDLLESMKLIGNFTFNNYLFSYNIKVNETPYQFSFDFKNAFKNKNRVQSNYNNNTLTLRRKNNTNLIKFKEVKYEKTIKAKTGTIYSIVKINNEEIAVSSGNEILIINIINDSEIYNQYNLFDIYPSLKGHTKNILCLALLSENILSSGSEDKTIKIWDINEKKCIKTISKDYKRIDSLLAYNSNILIIGAYNVIRILNIDTKEEILSLIGHEKTISSIIKINENILASCSYDNLIKIWDLNNQTCEFTLFGHDCSVFCILLLEDGRLVSGSGTWNKSIKIWNLQKKNCEFTLIGHKREVRDIKQISSSFIISASVDKTIKIWNLYKKICVQTLVSHYDVIFSLCIINKNRFVSGGRDQDIIFWKN